MTLQAVAWAIEFQDLPRDERSGRIKSSCKLVLLALANHAGADGCDCFPSVDTIGYYTGLSERAVQYALRDLQDHGTIARTPDPLVRSSTIGRPDQWPESYDLVAFQLDPSRKSRGARSPDGVQDLTSRGARSDPESDESDVTGCKVSGDLAPEPKRQNLKAKPQDTDADASDERADAHGEDGELAVLFKIEEPLISSRPSFQDLDLGLSDERSPKQPAASLQALGADDLVSAAAGQSTRTRRKRSTVAAAVNPDIQPIVRAWVDAYRASHPGVEPPAYQRGQVGREVKALLAAGNAPESVMGAATAAAEGGYATVTRQLAQRAARRSGGSGGGYRPYQQEATEEDYAYGAAGGIFG